MKVHFVGINGSGCSGAAIAAKKSGFDVSGCDMSENTPYAAQLRDAKIPVFIGHDAAHIDDADIVAVSAAFLEQKNKVAEVELAAEAGKLMKWQEFLGRYILPGKRAIAICGTHGKTTTSSLVAHILIAAGYDPTAFIGAIVPAWNSSNRFGASDWAVLEADEYANNFEHYKPEFAVLNNLEMEHPEYFRDWDHYNQTFVDFLQNTRVVAYNADNPGVAEILPHIGAKKIPFHAADFPSDWKISLLGAHNRSNAMAARAIANEIGIGDEAVKNALAAFRGTGHRLEKIFDSGDVAVFDDYAHHHTQVKSTIAAVREAYPGYRIIAVFEPHQISRYEQNTAETLAALNSADASVIVDFFKGREAHIARPDAAADIAKYGADKVRFIPDFDEAAAEVRAMVAPKTAIIVMGAGNSRKIGENLASSFK
ncbi:MAG: Mur ligase domain-containing protein [Rickettsiales bacterium]|jgi:UDP-N-acetylmuramate--alanine ligase|nr:Mur ligase domain-containing protein [Rickettsiales bacterium]